MIKGSLNGTRTYLIGPIDRVQDGGQQWRRELTPWLVERGINVIDPTHKQASIGIDDNKVRFIINDMKQEEGYESIRPRFRGMRGVDLRSCDVTDFVIAKVDVDEHLCGSYEEIFWTNRMKHPVLVWCPQGKSKVPSWLFLTLPHHHIFGSIESLKTYLDYIHSLSIEEVNQLDRWVIFEFVRE